MIIAAIILIFLYLYLRRPVWSLFQVRKIGNILVMYDSFFKSTESEKNRKFNEIARKRPLINDLFSSIYQRALSYDDFYDEEKIKQTYFALIEKVDEHEHNVTKFLHPKYFIKDLFFLPSAILGFLLNRNFEKSSFVVSCFTWIATVLISAYASEIRLVVDSLIEKIIELI